LLITWPLKKEEIQNTKTIAPDHQESASFRLYTRFQHLGFQRISAMSKVDTSDPINKPKYVKPEWEAAWNPEFNKLDTQPAPEPSKYGAFECRGDGLTCSEHHRADIPTLRRAVKTQQVPRTAPMSKNARKKWWAAQVKLYGLVCTAWDVNNCIKVLRAALENGLEGVPEYIAKTETELNEGYAKRKLEWEDKRGTLPALRDEKYNAASRDEVKAIIDPGRFLTESQGKVKVLRGVRGNNLMMVHLRDMARRHHLDVQCLGRSDSVMIIGKKVDVKAEKARLLPEIAAEDEEVRRQNKEKKRQATERRRQAEAAEKKARLEAKAAAKARHEELVRTGGGSDITGHWYLESPELDARRVEQGTFDEDDQHEMDIAAHQPGSEYLWAEFGLWWEDGWIRIRLPEGPILSGVEMKFGWQVEFERYNGVRHEVPNTGVITFDSPYTCFGSLEGWIGGPFAFRGFKDSVVSRTDPKECERGYREWRRHEYKWRRNWEYDLKEYDSVAEEYENYSDSCNDHCCC
jgi:hypothetical protein